MGWGGAAEPAEVPGNQKQMQLLRISTVNPPIPLFHCCVRILRHGGEDSMCMCVFLSFPPMLVVWSCGYFCSCVYMGNRQHIMNFLLRSYG